MVNISQEAVQLKMTLLRFSVLVFLLLVSLNIIAAAEDGRILDAESIGPVIAGDCSQARFSSIVLTFLQKPSAC